MIQTELVDYRLVGYNKQIRIHSDLMRSLFVIFVTVPIVEMYVLIQVGGIIGALPTVALVVLTATLGIWLLRLEGLATLAKVQEKLARGEIPGQELLEGIMLLIGGALLLTPGFVTDAIGFACLLPFLRKPIAHWLINKGMLRFLNATGSSHFQSPHGRTGGSGHPGDSTIIDGDFEDRTPPKQHLDE